MTVQELTASGLQQLGPVAHQHMAMQVLDALGVPHGLEELPPTPHAVLTAKELHAPDTMSCLAQLRIATHAPA